MLLDRPAFGSRVPGSKLGTFIGITVALAHMSNDDANLRPGERPEPSDPPTAPLIRPSDVTDRLLLELVEGVKQVLRREAAQRLRDVYLVGDIDKDSARSTIERLRELANDSSKPITFYVNSAGGNVTDGLAIHDAIRHVVDNGIQVTIAVQGMAYSMGSVVLQAASTGRRLAFAHSWIMIHEPAKWAGWQSTSAAAQHLERLKQMQGQIYRILAQRSGSSCRRTSR